MIVEKAWQHLADTKDVDMMSLRQEIALSWKRCLDRKMCLVNSKNQEVDDRFDEYMDRYSILYKVADTHMASLYEGLRGKGFIAILTTAEGVILRVLGDRKMYSRAESLALVPGGSCSENVLATTSPGICIENKAPVQVFLHEHYCQLYHDWCCSAAPIFDDENNLIGVLDVSNNDKSKHYPYIFDLVKMTAKSIGLEFDYRRMRNDFKKKYHYFNYVMDDMPEGLILFDEKKNLAYLNKQARTVLGGSAQDFLGENITAITKNYDEIRANIQSGKRSTNVQFITQHGLLGVEAYIREMKDLFDDYNGLLCTIKNEKESPASNGAARYRFEDIVHQSRAMEEITIESKNIASTDLNVLIRGESGTGKELFAQSIHNDSPRRNGPFVAVNCAGIPRELIQSELFGYEPGAFTGAHRKGKAGKFEQAHGGTIFLDEIGDMPLEAQANLLRVLQERSVVRIGGDQPKQLDIRVLSATNKDLDKEMEEGRFRQDLLYRLNSVTLLIPPLRERTGDLWLLFEHFFTKNCNRRPQALKFSKKAKEQLEQYAWPGNVRELENTAMVLLYKVGTGTVERDDLPDALRSRSASRTRSCTLEETEEKTIRAALNSSANNISRAAELLGISRVTLYRKIRHFKIEVVK